MSRVIGAFAAGLLFGAGLVLGRMTDPAVVLGFLDVAGAWNPALAFVMAGAVSTFGLCYALVTRRDRPLLDARLHLPTRNQIDGRLIAGTAIFGIGWGLVGVCPGPAITSLSTVSAPVATFVVAMTGGLLVAGRLRR